MELVIGLILEHLISNHRCEIMMLIYTVLACLQRLLNLRWVLLAHEHLCPLYAGADPRSLSQCLKLGIQSPQLLATMVSGKDDHLC